VSELGEQLRFELPGGGRALFTARAEGNLSGSVGEDRENSGAARARTCARAALLDLVIASQVHGSEVQRVRAMPVERGDQPTPDQTRQGLSGESADAADWVEPRGKSAAAADRVAPLGEADGHATAIARLGMTVLVADCLPVALGMPGAVAMLHAGWRGLAGGVLEEGVKALREVGGQDAAQAIVAVIGPGAGVCCYQVGEQVHSAFGGAHRHGDKLDLRALARDRLIAAGVTQITDAPLCTICDERFFSHRRDHSRAGRQAGIAWLT
jgi:YfiH family protein